MTGLALGTPEPEPPDDPTVLNRAGLLRLLLIEGPTAGRALVRKLLEEEFPHGHIDVATSLAQALHHLVDYDYDLILADLTLPDAEWEMVLRTVRGADPQTALMVITRRVDGTLALWTLAAGAQGYLIEGEPDGPRLAEAVLHGLRRSHTEQMAQARLASALQLESEVAQRLRELDTAHNNFVATASHELRTPLTSIAAYAEMLEDEVGLTARQTGFVGAIVRNAARLTALIEELLLLSGFNSTQVHMETLEVDVRDVVAAAGDVLAALATAEHFDVSLDLPTVPVLVTGDARQLEHVVLNLMSNAVKFTEPGGTITCRLSYTPTEVLLAVIDTGIGIPVAEQGQLFGKFFRGSQAYDRAAQGTGLGLHISATIVRDHGGDISVDSAPGRGSTFTVRLPALIGPDRVPTQPVPIETLFARFISLLGLPGDDPEVGDIAGMVDAALESAHQTDQWELVGDALRFAHGRLSVRDLVGTGLGDLGAAFVSAAGPRLTAAERARLQDLLAPFEEPEALPRDDARLGPLGVAYLELLLEGDRRGAVALARRCVTDGMSALEILVDILEPVQHEVGRRWALGHISIVQEHFCTAVTQFVMTDLYPGILEGQEEGDRRLLAVHAPGSMHHIGLRMVADVLECRGWSTTYVADDIAVPALISFLVECNADLLLVSASLPSQIPDLSALIGAVHQDPRTSGVKVVVGGRPFLVAPNLVEAVGAHGWARDARTAAEVCDALIAGDGG